MTTRRRMLAALACWPAASAWAQAEDNSGRPRHKISAGQLHQALAARFPLRLGVEDFILVRVDAARLHLLPSRNRLGAGLSAQASGIALQQLQAGEVDVSFGVRYEPRDRSLRAHDPELIAVHLPGMPPDALQPLQNLLAAAARDAVGEMVLYRFSGQDLALADTMGFEPESISVMDDGLMILFGPKQRP